MTAEEAKKRAEKLRQYKLFFGLDYGNCLDTSPAEDIEIISEALKTKRPVRTGRNEAEVLAYYKRTGIKDPGY